MVDSAPPSTFSQALAPLPPLNRTCLHSDADRIGSVSRRAFSQDLGPKGNNDPRVFYREPQCAWKHLTQWSCPRHPGQGGNHATSSEFQLNSDGNGTLPCNQLQTLLTPTQVGGREFATTVFPCALARKDIPLNPKGKALL